MTKNDYLRLQNGSDIRGVACEGVEGESINLTGEICANIAESFCRWLSKKTGKSVSELKIGVGRDSRVTGSALSRAVCGGLAFCGCRSFDCGLATTPAMFMSTVFAETGFDGAVMITASHLPFNRNGLKFFDREGCLEKEDITEILGAAEPAAGESWKEHAPGLAAEPEKVETGETEPKSNHKAVSCPLMNFYRASLAKTIRSDCENEELPLKGLHIVVDAGNGAGGFFASMLAELGADTSGSQFLEPDGMFPNHIPNPENKEAIASLKNAVIKNSADLGLIFDTDVDRMSAVFSDGREVNRDAIIALAAAILAPEYPGSTIVTDSVTSRRLTFFLENELGLHHHCFMRGYKNVINECKRLNAAGIVSPLAMETSGHGALKDNFYLDDGAFLAVKILTALARAKRQGKPLASLIEKLAPLVEEKEVRYKISGDDFSAYGEKVLEDFKLRAQKRGLLLQKTYEGVRISFDGDGVEVRGNGKVCENEKEREKRKLVGAGREVSAPLGWLLLRKSLHDPVMVMNIEGERVGDAEKILTVAEELREGFDRLD